MESSLEFNSVPHAQSTESSNPKKIIIVGGGLVGSLASLHLGKRGYDVHLFEYRGDIRHEQLVPGRSINLSLSTRGRQALAAVGLEQTLLKHGIPMRGRMLHDIQGRTRMVPYDAVTNQCIYSISRKHLNEILLSETENYPNIKLHFNQKLISADLSAGHIDMINPKTSERSEAFGDMVIGCDGAFSSVRKQMLKSHGFDYSQTYIEHGYIELCIPAKDGEFQMPCNYLHLWPRGQFMLIALPNQDKSWTVSLFMPFKKFAQISNGIQCESFFDEYFPDLVPLIGRERLVRDFFALKPQHLVSIKCNPYHLNDNSLLLGDAAHAMVPFFGQGMNAGFEDCTLLGNIFDELGDDNFGSVLTEFSRRRHADAHAVCDLAMHNYVEMRDLVTRLSFRLRKGLDDFLFWLLPRSWIPLYNAVSFSTTPYKQCQEHRQWQDNLLNRTLITFLLLFVCTVFISLRSGFDFKSLK